MTIPAWRDQALCLGLAPLFDATVADESPPQQEARHHRARAVCARCDVRNDCLAEAITGNRHVDGVWGGVVIDNLNNRKPPPVPDEIRHGTEAGYTAHRRRGEKACRRCMDGNLRAKQERERRRTA